MFCVLVNNTSDYFKFGVKCCRSLNIIHMHLTPKRVKVELLGLMQLPTGYSQSDFLCLSDFPVFTLSDIVPGSEYPIEKFSS